MKFNLQLFGGGKGGSSSSYTPSQEQKDLWNLQIQSAQDRQPNERYMNEQGRAFMEKVINMLNTYGAYGDLTNQNNYLARGDLAISQVDNLMRKLVRVADWHTESGTWQTEPLVEGKNSKAARDLRLALRGTNPGETDDNGATLTGFTQDLGTWAAEPLNDLQRATTKVYEFVAGNPDPKNKVVGINEPVGDLVTVVGGAVTTVNGDIDDYDGKYDSAATIASGSVSSAQGENDSLVSGLNTSLGNYNTLQSGKANLAESLLSGLNTSNNSAVTDAENRLIPLSSDTRAAATVTNADLDVIQIKGASALTTANNNLAGRSSESQTLALTDNNTLKNIFSDYDPSRKSASIILGDYRAQLDSVTPANNNTLDSLAGEFRNAAILANNELVNHVAEDVIDTAKANNALTDNRGNYNLASLTLDNGLNDVNNDLNAQLQDTKSKFDIYRTQLQTDTINYVFDTDKRIKYNDTAVSSTNSILGGHGHDTKVLVGDANDITDKRIKYNDDNANDIYNYSKNAANDATNTASNNNADLTEYIKTNKGGLSDSRADLADLKGGILPQNYLQNMEDAIATAMKNTIGKTINELGIRGVLNSSATTRALNDIEKNAADQLAQHFLQNIQTVQSLSNGQFEHVITTDHENAEMTRQKNDISQDALDRAFKYRQTGYEDLANNSDRNAELEQREYQRSWDSITRNIELTQQQYTNTATTSDRNAGLEQSKLAASQTSINQGSQLAQQNFDNAQNYAHLVSQNANSSYSGKIQSTQSTDNSVEQQLGNSQTSHNFGAQGTQNKYGNTMQGIEQRYAITNQQLSNVQSNVSQGTQIAQQDFNNKMQVGQAQEKNQSQQHANSVADVAQRAEWGQQAFTNSYNQNQFDSGVEQNKFGNTQTGIQNAATFAQDMFGNSTNVNQINANNINSGYNFQNGAINSNWGRTQAGYTAGYQNNLQAIQNAQTNFGNVVGAYNSEIGLHNNIFSNSLQGVNTKAGLYGQQTKNYMDMINGVSVASNSRANIALNTFSQYGQWALDTYRGKMQANEADTRIYQQAISQAGLPIQFAGAAQEGAMYLPTSMWNASIGLNAPTLGAMNGLAGTGTTTVTQSGDSFWSAFGAGVAGAGVQRLVGSL